MLELRPTCEHCGRSLPPDSMEARICSFECTFCKSCVEDVLDDVCPNCGGAFTPRPIRPAQDRVGGNFLGKYPAGERVVHHPVDPETHRDLVARVGAVAPQDR